MVRGRCVADETSWLPRGFLCAPLAAEADPVEVQAGFASLCGHVGAVTSTLPVLAHLQSI